MARSFTRASSNYAENAAAVLGERPMTLAAWGNLASLGAGTAHTLISISRNTGAVRDSFILDVIQGATNAVRAVTSESSTTAAASSTTGVSTGTWFHAAAVFMSVNDRRAYLNGAGKGTNATTVTPSGLNRTAVGRVPNFNSSPINYFDGNVAVPCIWNIALSDDEVAQLAAGFHPTMVRPEAIVAMWRMDQGSSPEPDNWGGYSLTLSGTTQVDDPPLIHPCGPLSVSASSGGLPPAATLFRRTLYNRAGSRGVM